MMRRPSEPTTCEHGVCWEYDCDACWLDACGPEDDDVRSAELDRLARTIRAQQKAR